jgi:hypothetical protein
MMRRLAGLALAAALLHLNLVRADVACGNHEQAENAGHGAHAMDHDGKKSADAVHHGGAPDVAPPDESCDTPIQSDCCQALASCSPAFGGDVAPTIRSFGRVHAVATSALIEIPRSRVTTPDPPPPKA